MAKIMVSYKQNFLRLKFGVKFNNVMRLERCVGQGIGIAIEWFPFTSWQFDAIARGVEGQDRYQGQETLCFQKRHL